MGTKSSKANPCPPELACVKCGYRKRMPQIPAGLCFACQRELPRVWTAAGAGVEGGPVTVLTRGVPATVVTVSPVRGRRVRHRAAVLAAGTAVRVVPAEDAGGWRDVVVELACGGRAFVPRDSIV